MWSDQYKQTCRRDRLTNLDPPELERLRKEHVKAAEIEVRMAAARVGGIPIEWGYECNCRCSCAEGCAAGF
jgi:hypothetical protein